MTRDADPALSSPQPFRVPSGTKVLVVDDEDLVRLVIGRTLRRSGFEVFEAHDGLDALQNMRFQRPDVVLSDLNMPRCNGERLCSEMKGLPDLADVPVVLMTGGPTDEERMHAAGCRRVLYKPLPADLAEILAAVMQPRHDTAPPLARRRA